MGDGVIVGVGVVVGVAVAVEVGVKVGDGVTVEVGEGDGVGVGAGVTDVQETKATTNNTDNTLSKRLNGFIIHPFSIELTKESLSMCTIILSAALSRVKMNLVADIDKSNVEQKALKPKARRGKALLGLGYWKGPSAVGWPCGWMHLHPGRLVRPAVRLACPLVVPSPEQRAAARVLFPPSPNVAANQPPPERAKMSVRLLGQPRARQKPPPQGPACRGLLARRGAVPAPSLQKPFRHAPRAGQFGEASEHQRPMARCGPPFTARRWLAPGPRALAARRRRCRGWARPQIRASPCF